MRLLEGFSLNTDAEKGASQPNALFHVCPSLIG